MAHWTLFVSCLSTDIFCLKEHGGWLWQVTQEYKSKIIAWRLKAFRSSFSLLRKTNFIAGSIIIQQTFDEKVSKSHGQRVRATKWHLRNAAWKLITSEKTTDDYANATCHWTKSQPWILLQAVSVDLQTKRIMLCDDDWIVLWLHKTSDEFVLRRPGIRRTFIDILARLFPHNSAPLESSTTELQYIQVPSLLHRRMNRFSGT